MMLRVELIVLYEKDTVDKFNDFQFLNIKNNCFSVEINIINGR